MNTIVLIIISKKPIDPYYSALTEEFELSHKVPKFNVESRLLIILRISLAKDALIIGQKKYM